MGTKAKRAAVTSGTVATQTRRAAPAPRKRLSYRVERSSKAPAKAALPKATPTPLVAKALATKAKREAVAAGRSSKAPAKAALSKATPTPLVAKALATKAKRAAVTSGTVANDDNAVGSFVELSIGVVWAFFFVDSRASSARNE